MALLKSFIVSLSLLAGAVLASSAEFVLDSNCHTGTFPYTLFTPIQYDSNGVVGIYVDCDTCYNFTGIITDEGYFEVTESSEGSLTETMYMNIDDETGLVTINDTAVTAPYLISTHLFYYEGDLAYTLLEKEYNETYYLYFLGVNYDVAALGTNYSTSLVTEFPNGTRYLYYEPDEATTTASFSTIAHIPESTEASSSTSVTTTSSGSSTASTTSESSSSTSSSSSSSSTSSSTGAAVASFNISYEEFGLFSFIAMIFGWVFTFGI
ncbi:hypothetical protein PACTADRAFT_49640 [Pachysolen tannophilus NRRL Y-2460]|uniref:Uncharacterized protein n=1 Tax=Pachysolen tannophilus NRRL Y-2460 TaxID=669874 RepID=A0A1E4TX00_PACTA|nr:hypothetical protein PACTADRAFT_49640 [Pachysolen tannophilus NRRL Y-2460]